MGLAASQARMLFLTARKNDVEYDMMGIANTKISLARESQDVSEEYNKALDQRKLVWAVNGPTATSSDTVDLTYGLLMKANGINNAGQFLIADSVGRVVLDSQYAQIMGVGAQSGSSVTMDRISFVQKCLGEINNVNLSPSEIASYGDPEAASSVVAFSTKYDIEGIMAEADTFEWADYRSSTDGTVAGTYYYSNDVSRNQTVLIGTVYSSDDSTTNIARENTSLKDDLYDASIEGIPESSVLGASLESLMTAMFGSGEDTGSVTFSDALKGTIMGDCGDYGNDIEAEIDDALAEAYERTYELYVGSMTRGEKTTQLLTPAEVLAGVDIGTKVQDVNDDKAINDAEDRIGIFEEVTRVGKTLTGDDIIMNDYYVNVNEMIQSFCAFFDEACEKYLPSSETGKTEVTGDEQILVRGSGGVVTGHSVEGQYNNAIGGTGYYDGSSRVYADDIIVSEAIDFYSELWSAIKEKGWVTNSSVDDNDSQTKTDYQYLQELIMNGTYHLEELESSMSASDDIDGGHYSASVWSDVALSDCDTPMQNVKDSDAIARAEIKYETEKDRIDAEETILDVKSDNLDTERSALDTEVDSVKKIIDKNIERTFKMFTA